MCFAECIAAAAHGVHQHDQVFNPTENFLERDKTNLLDLFRFIIESSKQHFNASYRLQGIKVGDNTTFSSREKLCHSMIYNEYFCGF